MEGWEHQGANNCEQRHRLRRTIHARAPVLSEQKQNRGDQRTCVTDTDPENEGDDGNWDLADFEVAACCDEDSDARMDRCTSRIAAQKAAVAPVVVMEDTVGRQWRWQTRQMSRKVRSKPGTGSRASTKDVIDLRYLVGDGSRYFLCCEVKEALSDTEFIVTRCKLVEVEDEGWSGSITPCA